MKKAIFIVAHPDDAEIVAGGTIKALVKAGMQVRVLNVTISEFSESTRQARCTASKAAAAILGHEVDWLYTDNTNQVEDIPVYKLVSQLDAYLADYAPDMVFTHTDDDSHWDHVCVSRAVLASSRKWGASLIFIPPSELRSPAYNRFCPNWFIDISEFVVNKTEAVNLYNFDGQNYRRLTAEDYINVNRAAGINIGVQYAESFCIIRHKGLLSM
jgi:N-acetylglucosamine malate deacetylase 1